MPTTLTIGGVSCTIALEDLGDSAIVESVSQDGGPEANVVFRCAYGDRYTLARALLGTSVAVGRTIVRTLPFAYPPSPNLYCLAIPEIKGIKPRRDATGWVYYQLAQLTAQFGRPKYDYTATAADGQNDPSGHAWTTTRVKVSAEVLTPPDGAFYIGPFSPNGKKVEEASVGIVRANCEVAVTRHFLPFVPLDEVMSLIGSTNLYPIQFSNHVFQQGCLLLVGCDTTPNTDPASNHTQEVTYTFLGKSNDWNQFIAKDGSLQFLNSRIDNTGTTPYSYQDFSILP